MRPYRTPFTQKITATALAVFLHLAVAGWWLSQQGSITPPEIPAQTMTVSLLNADLSTPTPPQRTPDPRPTPTANPVTKPQPEAAKPLSTAARTDAPASETAPAPSASAASAAAAPSNAPAAEAAAIVPPRFDAAYLNNPTPPYPGMSRRLNETGKVLLRVKVSPDGLPTDVDIAQSSGFPRLDEAAREAVRGWKFVPAKQGDKPVAATVQVPIAFKLN